MAPKQPPPLNAPSSETIVKISAIDSTMWLEGISCKFMYNPEIKGFDKVRCGTWSFLIEHPSGRKLLYDLGCRKDWKNLPPALGIDKLVEDGILAILEVKKNVADILKDDGVKLEEIEGVIWSHWYDMCLVRLLRQWSLTIQLLVKGISTTQATHQHFQKARL